MEVRDCPAGLHRELGADDFLRSAALQAWEFLYTKQWVAQPAKACDNETGAEHVALF